MRRAIKIAPLVIILGTFFTVECLAFTARPAPKKSDFLIVRTDTLGTVIWARNLGHGFENRCYAAIETREGGFAFIGTVDSCDGRWSRCMWMVVTDSAGSISWEKEFTSIPYPFITNFLQLPDGRFVVGGVEQLLCLSSTGDQLWVREFEKRNECCETILLPDGGFLLAGNMHVRTAHYGDLPLSDVWVMKTDSAGNSIWSKTLGGDFADYMYDALVAADGRIVVVGEKYSDAHPDKQQGDGWIVILDSDGNIISERTYGKSIGIRLWDVYTSPSNGFTLMGETSSRMWPWTDHAGLLMEVSQTGDSLWSVRDTTQWKDVDSQPLPYRRDRTVAEYLDQVIRLNSERSSQLLGMRRLTPMFEWLRANGYPGRVLAGRTRICNGGYVYCATYEFPLPSPPPPWTQKRIDPHLEIQR